MTYRPVLLLSNEQGRDMKILRYMVVLASPKVPSSKDSHGGVASKEDPLHSRGSPQPHREEREPRTVVDQDRNRIGVIRWTRGFTGVVETRDQNVDSHAV